MKKSLNNNLLKGFVLLAILEIWGVNASYAIPFGMESAVNYENVAINFPNNPNDITGFGSVSYAYKIGKFEVTIGQYATFLNHVAAESDPYKLWNPGMLQPYVQGISRTGAPGSYIYTVIPMYSPPYTSSADMPITWLSWFSMARFSNWLANGQPIGGESSGTTETGAYNLNGQTSGRTVTRNSLNPNSGMPPSYYIPTEDEWYKAAYYNPQLNGSGGYNIYATQSNKVPSNIIGSGPNLANFLYAAESGYCVTQTQILESASYLTNVGTFSDSPSFFGTYDQSGNVWEMNDLTGQASLQKGLRGAAWTSTPEYMTSSYRLIVSPASGAVNLGFRLSSPTN